MKGKAVFFSLGRSALGLRVRSSSYCARRATIKRMSTETESVTRCDRCGSTADGDRVDCVDHLKCGHDVCTNCERSLHRQHPEVVFPLEWCAVCERAVGGPYAN